MTDNWFDMRHKNVLQRCPPTADPHEWAEYIALYAATENLKDIGHPLQLDIELNGGCNMTCPFCTHGQQVIPNLKMDADTYKRTIDSAVALGIRSVKLNYINEPLMRRDLEELIEYAMRAGMLNSYFVTNGLLLTKKRRARLLESGLTKLFCSIDAATSSIYDQQRTDGRFEIVRGNVQAFIAERNAAGREFPQVVVSFLRNKINQHEAEMFESQWEGIADVINFQTMNEVPDTDTGLTLGIGEPEYGCKFPFKQIVIDHKGNILPCCKLAGAKLRIGNIDTMHLWDAWLQMKSLREMHGNGEWQRHPICSKCMRCE